MKVKRVIEIESDLYEDCRRLGVMGSITAKAIADSKPYDDSGDLISREALKKALDELFESGGYDSGLVMNTIDNAPTVDIKDQIAGAYNEGYMCGNKEAEKARPQGK